MAWRTAGVGLTIPESFLLRADEVIDKDSELQCMSPELVPEPKWQPRR